MHGLDFLYSTVNDSTSYLNYLLLFEVHRIHPLRLVLLLVRKFLRCA